MYSAETESCRQEGGTAPKDQNNNNNKDSSSRISGRLNHQSVQENTGAQENSRHQRKGSNSVSRDPSTDFVHNQQQSGRQNFSSQREQDNSDHRKSDHQHKLDLSRSRSLGDVVEPLNAERLRPIRQKTRNAVVSILDDGEVSLEFLHNKHGQDCVVEVLRISPNGMKILVFHPNGKKGVALSSVPPEAPPSVDTSYLFSGLPTKYWKKYQYAAKFVQLVRKKTPKVSCSTVQYAGLETATNIVALATKTSMTAIKL